MHITISHRFILNASLYQSILYCRSEKWNLVSEEKKRSLCLTQALDGEFWMSYPDFCQYFARVYICTLGPDFDMDGVVDKSKCQELKKYKQCKNVETTFL